jgi:predicted transcriptional regulator
VCHKTEKQHKAVVKVKLNKTDEKVYQTLKTEGKELTLQELADKTGESPKKIFRSLRKLFEHEIIETQARKYKLTGKDPKAAGKGEEEPENLPE